jgi:hypothetical protein
MGFTTVLARQSRRLRPWLSTALFAAIVGFQPAALAQRSGGRARCRPALSGVAPGLLWSVEGDEGSLSADLDGDGQPERVTIRRVREGLRLLVQQGTSVWSLDADLGEDLSDDDWPECLQLTTHDLTGDGINDLILVLPIIAEQRIHVWRFAPNHVHGSRAGQHGPFEHTAVDGGFRMYVTSDRTLVASLPSGIIVTQLRFIDGRFAASDPVGEATGTGETGPLEALPPTRHRRGGRRRPRKL